MKRILTAIGFVVALVGCANDGGTGGVGSADTGMGDTVVTPNTTYYGGAGTSGVGAGFGPGGRAGADTNLPVGADTTRAGGGRHVPE
jgi:hypothetical protein